MNEQVLRLLLELANPWVRCGSRGAFAFDCKVCYERYIPASRNGGHDDACAYLQACQMLDVELNIP